VVFGSRVFFFLGFGGGSVFCLLFCIQFPSIESKYVISRFILQMFLFAMLIVFLVFL
jgi:hypothetical protein